MIARREFLRARFNSQGGLDLFANQGSGVLTSVVWADGLVDNPLADNDPFDQCVKDYMS